MAAGVQEFTKGGRFTFLRALRGFCSRFSWEGVNSVMFSHIKTTFIVPIKIRIRK